MTQEELAEKISEQVNWLISAPEIAAISLIKPCIF